MYYIGVFLFSTRCFPVCACMRASVSTGCYASGAADFFLRLLQFARHAMRLFRDFTSLGAQRGRFTCAFCTRLNLFIAFIISHGEQRGERGSATLKWKIQDSTGSGRTALWDGDKIYFSSSFSTFFYPPLYFLFAPLGSLSLPLLPPFYIK